MELKKIKYIHTISQSNQRKGVKKIKYRLSFQTVIKWNSLKTPFSSECNKFAMIELRHLGQYKCLWNPRPTYTGISL